jgi:hypothetical protein
MDMAERRVIGSLLLLLGLTFFTVALYTGQLQTALEIVKRVFQTAIEGAP